MTKINGRFLFPMHHACNNVTKLASIYRTGLEKSGHHRKKNLKSWYEFYRYMNFDEQN